MILEVENLVSGYGKQDILRGVSLKARRHQITCIIGPNGAGKSTLCKTIFRLLKAKNGTIYFDGENITNLGSIEVLKRGLSYIPQGRCIFPALTVEENLKMGAYLRDDKEKIKEDIESVYQKFPILKERKNQYASYLSGGEQQQLEIGIALLMHPKLILFDEPSLGLAPKLITAVYEEIERLRNEGVTVLIAEQNVKKVLSVSHYVYVLDLGQNRFEGSPKEIMNNNQMKRLYLGGR